MIVLFTRCGNLFASNLHLDYNQKMPKNAQKTLNLKTLLRKSGYKATPTRLAVLALLQKSRNPVSAQDIMDALRRSTGRRHAADQATVYRTVKSLKQKGIIRQIDLRQNHAHYEFADMAEHHHLVCAECGKIEDVRHCKVEDWEGTVLRHSKHFAEIRQHALEFYGVCKACASRTSQKK
jgi:Fe2+ or Zn2+ uptake regulation protein